MRPNPMFSRVRFPDWVLAILVCAGVVCAVQSSAQSLEFRSAAEGGRTMAVHVAGDYAYTGLANVLVVRDITNPASPAEVADRLLGGDVRDVTGAGNYLFVAASQAGLVIFDVSDPTHPLEVAAFDTPGSAASVALSGSTAYVADETGGLRIIDVTNPAVPSEIAAETTSAKVTGVAVDGGYVFLSGAIALLVVDVSTPSSPVVSGSYDQTAESRAVALQGNHAYLTIGIHFMSIDITDKANPVFVDAGLVDMGRNFALAGSYAFVPGQSGMRIFDIADPAQITLAGAVTARQGYDVALVGDLAYAAQGLDGFDIRNVANVASPEVVFDGRKGWDEGTAVALAGNLAYVSVKEDLLKVVDLSNPDAITEVGNMPFTPYPLPPQITAVAATGTHAFVAQGVVSASLEIVDVTNPTQPAHVGTYTDPLNGSVVNTMQALGGRLYTARGTFGLRIYDISNPLIPVAVGSAFTTGDANDFAVDADVVYVMDGAPLLGLRVFDTSALPTVTEIGSYPTPGVAGALALDAVNDRLYVADEGYGLIILDVSTPASPSKLGELTTLPNITDVAISGTRAYVVDAAGVHVVDVVDPSSPEELTVFQKGSGGELQVVTNGDAVLILDPLAGLVSLRAGQIASGIGAGVPARDGALSQNTPNPFNPQTVIRYVVDTTGPVRLQVFDVGGRLVRTLVEGVSVSRAEPYSVVWDGRDDRGSLVSSGVYFYRFLAPGIAETKRMVLLK